MAADTQTTEKDAGDTAGPDVAPAEINPGRPSQYRPSLYDVRDWSCFTGTLEIIPVRRELQLGAGTVSKKSFGWNSPGGPGVKTMLPMQGAQVLSLVGLLRFHMLCSTDKKVYLKKIKEGRKRKKEIHWHYSRSRDYYSYFAQTYFFFLCVFLFLSPFESNCFISLWKKIEPQHRQCLIQGSFDLVDSGNRCILLVSVQIVGVSFFLGFTKARSMSRSAQRKKVITEVLV